MASSQVEMTSSSPFGRVLKDQNSRCRESNARAAAFQKNLTELVRDRLHNCISVSTNENSQNQTKKNLPLLTGNENKTTHLNLRFLAKNNENEDGNDQSSVLNSSQARILDRWAAKQAREMVYNIEKQSQEAELLGSPSSSSSSKAELGDSSANLGASSLVQIWEARLNINGMNNNNNLNPVSTTSRTSSGLSNIENVASSSSPRDSVDERPESVHGNNPDNSLQDWETQSDRTARSSDAGESERVRIADIIKRFTSGGDDNNENELGSNVCESPSREQRRHAAILEPVEQREQQQQRGGLTQLVSSPKIRGRQAFADLLMQMERDRHRELNSLVERQAVSKFPQRGRIQSMLRLKFMQRGMALRDLGRPQSAESPSNRVSRGGSSIMQLREKFGTGIENGVTTQISTAISKNPHVKMANARANQDESSTSSRLCENNHAQEVSVAQKSIEGRGVEERMGNQVKDPPPRTDDTEQQTNSKNTLLDSQETAETSTSLNVCDGNEMGGDQEATSNHQQENSETKAILDDRNENETTSEEQEASVLDDQNENETAYEEEVMQANDQQQQLFLIPQETTETVAFMDNSYENELAAAEEEEEAYDDHQSFQYNNDWITEISRPRSHWERIRQAWYEERLSRSADNDEIRQLIERKRVSTFLSSDFRNTMDGLMASRTMTQADMEEYYDEEDEESQERVSQLLLAHLQRHLHPATTSQEEEQTQERDDVVQVDQVEQTQERDEVVQVDQVVVEENDDDHHQEEEEDEDEEQEDHRSSITHPFHEASEYFQSSSSLQMPSPSMLTSWSFRDNEVGDDSDPIAPPSPQPLPSQDSRRSHDSSNRLSIEMELIYDLRGQMEQLHREMAELRKSLQSCVDMQAKMQHSNQQQVHSVKVMANNPAVGAPTKRSCCICYEMQVDSLLYRCGHMCTCLKCAHELHWSSGKCPICRAPIDDVVRVYMDA